MMTFDFACRRCLTVTSVKSPVGKAPKAPCHHGKPMRRLYSPTRVHVHYGQTDLVERAYRGEETVPGMTTAEVRATVDTLPKAR